MTKQHLLVVDGDLQSLRTLEVSLRTAGFAVTTAINGRDAFTRCRMSRPDLVLSETALPEMDGFELCRKLKSEDRLKDIPFMFLTARGSVDEKVRGLELGVQDYLTKPLDVSDLVARIRNVVATSENQRLVQREQRTSFSASLAEMPISDLVEALAIGRKSGTVAVESEDGRRATMWIRDGRVLDAVAGRLGGEAAFHRVLRWRRGSVGVEFGPVSRPRRIQAEPQQVLLDGVQRAAAWERTLAKLPAQDAILQIDYLLLSDRLAEIPDDVNAILKLVDGRRTLAQILDESEHDELATASAVAMLFRERIIAVRPALPSDAPHLAKATPGSLEQPVAVPAAEQPGTIDWSAGPVTPAPPPLPTGAPRAPETDHRDVGAAPPRIVRFAAKSRQSPSPERSPAPAGTVARPRKATRALAIAAAAALVIAVPAWIALASRGGSVASQPPAAGQSGAIEALRRAIELDQSNAAAYMALARACWQEKRVEEAKAAYQRYLALDPHGTDAAEARAALASLE